MPCLPSVAVEDTAALTPSRADSKEQVTVIQRASATGGAA